MNWLQQLVRRLFPSGQFARNVSVLAGGAAFSQALAVLAVPLLTRLYPAEAFGYLQVYMSCMSVAVIVVALRYEFAILLPEEEEVAANVTVIALCSVAVVTACFIILVLLVSRVRLLPSSMQGMQGYLWFIPVGACGAGVYQTFSYWALRQKAYKQVTATKVTQVGAMLGTQSVFGFLHPTAIGLLLGDAIGRTVGSLSLGRLSWRRNAALFHSVRWQSMWNAARRYRHFPLVSTGSSIVSAAGVALPVLFLGKLYGAKVLGWYALADRVVGAPALLIGQAISQVYAVDAARLSASDPTAMRAMFLKLAKRLALLGIVPFTLFAGLSPFLFAFIFGSSWREAGIYASLLALMHFAAFIAWPLTPTLNVLERQFLQLAWDLGRLVLTLGGIWVAYRFGWAPRGAIALFGASILFSYLSYLALSLWAIQRRIRSFQPADISATVAEAEYTKAGGVGRV